MEKTLEEERSHYSRAFKHSVIDEYLQGGITKAALIKKHNIKVHGGILRWMRQLGYLDNCEKDRYLPDLKQSLLSSKNTHKVEPLSDHEVQTQRIKELERLLEDEKLRSEAYKRIIVIAEKEFNIPIQKKPGTK